MTSEEPLFIIRPEEVMDPSTRPKGNGTLTWHFVAENVRDFAWVSSKTYVWDAAGFRYESDILNIQCPTWNDQCSSASSLGLPC